MTVDDVFASSRTIIVAGKGGVGKTTVSAALACAAARRGLRVLFVELDGKPIPTELTSGEGHISTMSLTAGDALVDYLEHHGLGRLAKRFASTGILDVIAAAAPGLDDLLVLGRIKALERS
ncbi:MAG: ArsA-related P-loop ATPase, partial [Ilumatobacteraceae bacterium]